MLAGFLFAAVAGAEPPLPAFPPGGGYQAPAPSEEPAEEGDAAAALYARMSLEQRIAQLMLVTPEGRIQPNAADASVLERYPPGGILIRQISRPKDAHGYIARLRALETRTGVPLLAGADLYRLGQRDRMALSNFAPLPSFLALGATRDPEAVGRTAGIIAEHLEAMGFDFFLGPALELAPSIPGAPGAVGCFGGDPAFTATAAEVIVGRLHESAVLAAPTGFPGGGLNTTGRSPAVLLTPPTILAEEDLRPYRASIAAGVRLLHVGPTLVPTLDTQQRPACLSPAVMRGLLRGQLGYEGVVIAGPMEHPAITQHADPAEAAVLALEAGADLLYWQSSGALVVKAIAAIGNAVQRGRLDESALEASVMRVLALKLEQRASGRAPETERKLERLEGRRDFVQATQAIERRAITLVQNRGLVLPLSKEASMPVGITGVTAVQELWEALQKHIKPIAQQRIGTARHIGRIQRFEIDRIVSRIPNMRTVICVFSDEVAPEGQAELIHELQARGKQVVLVLLGYPKHLPQLAEADAILVTYGDPVNAAETMRAVAEVLVGRGPIEIIPSEGPVTLRAGETRVYNALDLVRVPSGKLPVTLSEAFPAGTSAPYDPREAIRRVEWDFGTGRAQRGERIEYAYAQPGHFTLTLRVTDVHGESQERSFPVEVLP